MIILLVGATGVVGSRVLSEAVRRGHGIAALVRNPALFVPPQGVSVFAGDALNADRIAEAASGASAAVTAFGTTDDPADYVSAAHALIAGLVKADVKRIVIVGSGGTLEVADGVALLDTPEFPEEYKPLVTAHRDVLAAFRRTPELEWTVATPPLQMQPGVRTGTFRIGGDRLLTDMDGGSCISTEDFAVAIVDQVERRTHLRQRITVAY
jgi:hypothetical protein